MSATHTVLLAAGADQVSTGEAVAFWILGPVALLGAIGMVLLRRSLVLDDSALLAIAHDKGQGHLLAMSERPRLPPEGGNRGCRRKVRS